MKIIAFSGVDGSGKSTQRALLQEYLESQGHKVSYFHATEFSLANRLKRGSKNFVPGQEKAVTKANFCTAFLRLIFLALDGLRFSIYTYNLKRHGVTILVSDRFFQDSLLNITFLSSNFFIRFIVQILANILPVPEYTFYLKLTVDDILTRERIPEQGSEYIEKKIALYENPPFSWNRVGIDATQSPDSIHQSVIGMLRDV